MSAQLKVSEKRREICVIICFSLSNLVRMFDSIRIDEKQKSLRFVVQEVKIYLGS